MLIFYSVIFFWRSQANEKKLLPHFGQQQRALESNRFWIGTKRTLKLKFSDISTHWQTAQIGSEEATSVVLSKRQDELLE